MRSRPAGRILPVCVRCLFPPTPISLHFAVPLVRSPRARARPCPPAPSPPACRAPPPLRLPPSVCCRLPVAGGAHAVRGVSRAGRAPAGCGVCVGCGGGGARARAPPPGPFPYRPPPPPPFPLAAPARAHARACALNLPPPFFPFPCPHAAPLHARTHPHFTLAGRAPQLGEGRGAILLPPLAHLAAVLSLFFRWGVVSGAGCFVQWEARARALWGVSVR